MAVKRILDIDIRNKGLFSAIYGNISDGEFFVDSDLKKYNLWQQLFVYLKSMLYDNVVFYDTTNNFHSYSKSDLARFLNLEEETKNKEPQKYQSRHIRSALGSRRNKKEAEKTVKPKDEKQINSAIKLVTDFGEKNNFYRTNETLEIENYLKINLANKKKKTALIIKNPENSTFQGIEKYITLFKTLDNNYAKDESLNKVIIVHNNKSTNSFISSFSSQQLFLNDFFRNLFIKKVGENNFEIVKKNVHKIELSDEIELQNLINEIRITDKKETNFTNIETIVSSLKKRKYTISDITSKLKKVSKINIEKLISAKIIEPPYIKIDDEKLQKNLNKVIGQSEITKVFSKKIKSHFDISRDSPLSFMMVGTSGVGKTFTAELISESLKDDGFIYVPLKMTEFQTEDSVNKLIGSPTGYIGSQTPPQLFAELKKSSRLVILFDEIEKANERVITTLMQLLDKGEMNWNEKTGDFKDCIILFTSNASRKQFSKLKNNHLKGVSENIYNKLIDKKYQNKLKDILHQSDTAKFKTEFCGRINTYLVYNTLMPKDIIKVSNDYIKSFSQKKYDLSINHIDSNLLGQFAFDFSGSQYGLRDLKTSVKDLVSELLSSLNIVKNNVYSIEKNIEENIFYLQTNNTDYPNNSIDSYKKYKMLIKESKVINRDEIDLYLSNIKGQDDSIQLVKKSISMWFLRKEKPLSLFFVGPSGVGKTETAKMLAKSLESKGYDYHRIDCNMLNDETGKNRILGSSTGYMGSDVEPELFSKQRVNNKLIILFDEIEKSHPSVLISLMNLIDEGKLSWNNDTRDFSECILIFTSNLSQEIFIKQKQNLINRKIKIDSLSFQNSIKETLTSSFREQGLGPEIPGRITKTFVFNLPNKEMIQDVSYKIIQNIVQKHNCNIIEFDENILNILTKVFTGNDKGIRPIKNFINENMTEAFYRIYEKLDDDESPLDIAVVNNGKGDEIEFNIEIIE